MTQKRFRRVCAVVAAIGFALLLGTAGASDAGIIPMSRILWQSAAGLAAFGAGLWLGGYLS